MSDGEPVIMENREFRFIIGKFKIKRKNWFEIIKLLEKKKILKFKKKYILINIKPEVSKIIRFYISLQEELKPKEEVAV